MYSVQATVQDKVLNFTFAHMYALPSNYLRLEYK